MVEGARIGTRPGVGTAALKRLIVIGLALFAVLLILFIRYRAAQFYEPASLLSRFPAEGGSALSIDFKTLRDAGLLSASKSPVEPDYKEFLDGTGLDYRRDLDQVVASFSKTGNYFIARGRFDWNKLRKYAVRQGGSCYQNLCRMQGSRPDRRISFVPLRSDTIALAVSADDLAAARLLEPGPRVTSPIPTDPVWVSIPGAVLEQPGAMPRGLRIVLSALIKADRVLITAGATGAGLEAHLDATCRTADDARVLESQLKSATGMLKSALPNGKDAAPDQLALALAAGAFDASGKRVTGKWPIGKDLIQSLTSGI